MTPLIGSVQMDVSNISRHGGKIIGGSFLSTACLFTLFTGAQAMSPGLTRTLLCLTLIACFFTGAWIAVLQETKRTEEVLPRLVAYIVGVLVLYLLASIV